MNGVKLFSLRTYLSVTFSQQQLLFAVEAPSRPTDTASEGGKQTPSYVSLSDKYAIVDAAGTQMLLEEGRWYTCNRLQVPVAHSAFCIPACVPCDLQNSALTGRAR